jgi:hypothetical protein
LKQEGSLLSFQAEHEACNMFLLDALNLPSGHGIMGYGLDTAQGNGLLKNIRLWNLGIWCCWLLLYGG